MRILLTILFTMISVAPNAQAKECYQYLGTWLMPASISSGKILRIESKNCAQKVHLQVEVINAAERMYDLDVNVDMGMDWNDNGYANERLYFNGNNFAYEQKYFDGEEHVEQVDKFLMLSDDELLHTTSLKVAEGDWHTVEEVYIREQ